MAPSTTRLEDYPDPALGPARAPTAAALGLMEGLPPPPGRRVTLPDWDRPPANRWGFSHVEMLVPTAPVARGFGPMPAWPDRAAEDAERLLALPMADHLGRPTTVGAVLARDYTDGFLVWTGGRLVLEHYDNAMTRATRHLSQSVAKSVTGLVAGCLVGTGQLDLEAPLTTYVPELARCGYDGARVRDVCDMVSGVAFDEDYLKPDSHIALVDVAAQWKPWHGDGPRPTLADLILSLERVRPHDGIFDYRSIETDVLAWAMMRAAGADLATLTSQHLWRPMGAECDAAFTVDAAGTALADGGLLATLRDYARVGLVVLGDGLLEGRQVVPAAFIRRLRAADPARFHAPYTLTSPGGAYGGQWWLHDPARGILNARGIHGQLIWVDPSTETVAVKLSAWPEPVNPRRTLDCFAAIAAVAAACA